MREVVHARAHAHMPTTQQCAVDLYLLYYLFFHFVLGDHDINLNSFATKVRHTYKVIY